jgi:membrane protease YdiL (CAAX protease family)
VLHLFPGLAMATFVVLTAPLFAAWGMDPLFALFIGIGVVIAPLELGYLSLHARRTTGSWSPLAVVDYRAKLPLRRVLLLGGGLAGVMLVFVVAQLMFLDRLIAPLFSWMPDAIFQMSVIEQGGDPLVGGALVALLAAGFVFNGVVGPVTEELYFRGHLLPRIDRFGRGAPVLNTALFTLYHFHTPWRYPVILLGYLPIAWTSWRRRSFWVGLAAHMVINNVFVLMMLAAYLAGA